MLVMTPRRPSRTPPGLVEIGAPALTIVVFWLRPLLERTGDGWSRAAPAALAAVLAVCMPARWRAPVVCTLLAGAVTLAGWALAVSDDPLVGAAWCLYPAALRAQRGPATAHLVGAALVLVAGSTSAVSIDPEVWRRLWTGLWALAASWALGRAEARRRRADLLAAEERAGRRRAERDAALAREVHDVVGHALSVIGAEADVARTLPGSTEIDLRESLERIERHARNSLADVQALVRSLRTHDDEPPAAHPTGTLRRRVEDLAEAVRGAGIDVDLVVGVEDVGRGPRTVALRVVQESLTNVVRHSGARSCAVVLETLDDGAALHLRIDDDGAGTASNPAVPAPGPAGTHRSGASRLRPAPVPVSDPSPDLASAPAPILAPGPAPALKPAGGLAGMRERVEAAGGRLTVIAAPGRGTSVDAVIPLEAA